MPAVIGITTYGIDEQNRFRIPREYVDSVRRSGAIPLLIPPGEIRIDELLATLDALILAGGGDLDPSWYGGPQHETVYHVDRERDAAELELARRVIAEGFPTLAICRGLQVANVALGGTLHVHLPDVVGESVLHRLPPREPTEHWVRVEPDSRIAAVVGELEFSAASWHHQALCKMAGPLRVAAYAPDGVIEAAEIPEHPWFIGLQWHPELTASRDPRQQRIFDSLVAAARDRKRARGKWNGDR